MKKFIGAGLFFLAVLLLVIVLSHYLPKYGGFLKFLFVYLLLDAGLWMTVKKRIRSFRSDLKILLHLIYWLPVLLLVVSVGFAMKVSYLDWNIALRTNLTSTIMILFIARAIPMTTWIISLPIQLFRHLYRSDSGSVKSGTGDFFSAGKLLSAGWIIGALLFILLLWGMIFGQYAFQVTHTTISLRELPASFNGYRIVQISDIHLGSWTDRRKLAIAVDTINRLKPDAIFITGDMFNFNSYEGESFLQILSQLTAPDGIFAIPGNHDYGDYVNWDSPELKRKNMELMTREYGNMGWKMLMNTHDIIRRGPDSIAVLGVHNWGATRRFQRLGDVDKARKGAENVAVQLLLSHDPSYWEQKISRDHPEIDVTFSGHTHGGQFGINNTWMKWSPASWIYPMWSGLYSVSHARQIQYLYVNQGLGSIGYAGRIGIWPEISLITLKSIN